MIDALLRRAGRIEACLGPRGVVLGALACYALVLWWPFTLAVPQRLDNGARWTAEGSLRTDAPGLALSPAAPAWQARARDTGELRISLRARALAARQRGPARLFTLSRDTYVQNLVIGQSGGDLVVRIRSACSRQAAGCRRQMRLADVFASPQWQEIELEISPGSARLSVAGRAERRITLPDDALRVWDGTHRLALANDVTGLRPWRGELGRAVVAVDGATFDCLDASTVELPPAFWLTEREPKLIPFRNARPADIVVNLLLFVPSAWHWPARAAGHAGGRCCMSWRSPGPAPSSSWASCSSSTATHRSRMSSSTWSAARWQWRGSPPHERGRIRVDRASP